MYYRILIIIALCTSTRPLSCADTGAPYTPVRHTLSQATADTKSVSSVGTSPRRSDTGGAGGSTSEAPKKEGYDDVAPLISYLLQDAPQTLASDSAIPVDAYNAFIDKRTRAATIDKALAAFKKTQTHSTLAAPGAHTENAVNAAKKHITNIYNALEALNAAIDNPSKWNALKTYLAALQTWQKDFRHARREIAQAIENSKTSQNREKLEELENFLGICPTGFATPFLPETFFTHVQCTADKFSQHKTHQAIQEAEAERQKVAAETERLRLAAEAEAARIRAKEEAEAAAQVAALEAAARRREAEAKLAAEEAERQRALKDAETQRKIAEQQAAAEAARQKAAATATVLNTEHLNAQANLLENQVKAAPVIEGQQRKTEAQRSKNMRILVATLAAATVLTTLGVAGIKKAFKSQPQIIERGDTSILSLGDKLRRVTIPKPSFDTLILPPAFYQQLDATFGGIAAAIKQGLPMSNMLFYGEAGVGKTMTAKLFMRDLYHKKLADFIIIRGPAFKRLNSPGKAQKALADALRWGRNSKRPVIYLFDEADAMFRDRSSPEATEMTNDLVTTMLSFFERAIDTKSMFILCTNYPNRLDKALLNRIDPANWLRFPPPGPEEIKRMLTVYLHEHLTKNSIGISKEVEAKKDLLAQKLNGFVGRQIESLVTQTLYRLLSRQAKELDLQTLEESIARATKPAELVVY